MSAAALVAVLALIGLAACTAVWLGERDVERQDKERVAQVTAAATPEPRGWHATNYEVTHEPTARETTTGFLPACTCRFDCLRFNPRADHPWPTAGEATAEADRLLRERGSK